MSVRAQQYPAVVLRRETLSQHLVRLVLGGPGLAAFTSTGLPDEWVGLVVPGQFQSRYYTVRSWSDGELTVDVVVHAHGLVTDWAAQDCTGDVVTVLEAKGSFVPPYDAQWVVLVGDLTALPAMARISESIAVPMSARVWVDAPEVPSDYLPPGLDVRVSDDVPLTDIVTGIDWPAGPGYFWMAGESAQMRAIRKHVMRDLAMPPSSYSLMGYWRAGATRQPRAVDA